ncbi:MAG: ATP-binding protein [Acidimicrobiia bacterium]
MRDSEHRLPADLDAPAKGRRLVEAWAAEHDRLHALVLAVSELVTNAVVHGAPATELTIRFGSTGSMIRVVVAHLGSVFEPRLERGYSGLSIVDRIVDRWGIEERDDSVEVWFEVDDVPADTDVQTLATGL